VSVLRGDCVEVMASLADNSIDAIVTDPPYGLEFMGKQWDRIGGDAGQSKTGLGERPTQWTAFGGDPFGGGNPTCATCGGRKRGHRSCSCAAPDWRMKGAIVQPQYGEASREMQRWHERWAREAYRILKPGGHLLAFGGSRTYHRLAAGIEDAGFEIRDQLMWVYASGFPKSHNLDGEWSGWGTALKPAHEPIVMARKPLIGTVAQNVQEHGTGALNIDGCRIPSNGEAIATHHGTGRGVAMQGNADESWPKPYKPGDSQYEVTAGRWPANVILTDPVFDGGWDGVVGGGEAPSTGNGKQPTPAREGWRGDSIFGAEQQGRLYGDTGTYSRFFLVPKAPTRERTLTDGRRSPHPTQKPEALIRHLVTMVTPPGGIVLDPFLGSGTLGVACEALGVRWLGIEREDEYADWAEDRIADRKAKWEVTA